ncbi:MAG TPA: glutaredoxin domain-containing protein [Candidatus Saccharimonadales bacterium]|jgi:glutaredoxin-like YruB-family protein|nr:glutaredoxin domain-containing protein [Candidatus Saccharimonadales bacterium]
MDSASVTIYSAPWCAFCHAAKDYLDKLGVKYVDKDVDSDKEIAKESMEKSGQAAIPVLDIGGTIIVGFDRAGIDEALKANKLLK